MDDPERLPISSNEANDMTNDTIRVGIIGAGANTRKKHIPGLTAIDGVEIVSVSNRTMESSRRAADELGIPTVYEHWTELIAAPDTDAICIGTWPYMHRDMVLASLEAGKHVLTEARMAMSVAQAREMLDASRRAPHLVAQIVPAPFTLFMEGTVQRLIADGYLGDILSIDATASWRNFIDREGPFTWRHDFDMSGYNVMLLGAVYENIQRLVGHATSVTAVTKVNVAHRKDETGRRRAVPVPDHAEVLCEMACCAVLRMRFSEVTGLDLGPQMWLFGSEGTLKINYDIFRNDDVQLNRLWGGRKGDEALSEIKVPQADRGTWRVEEEFIGAIRGQGPVTHTTFEDGVRYMELTEAVTLSAQSGRTVHLPL